MTDDRRHHGGEGHQDRAEARHSDRHADAHQQLQQLRQQLQQLKDQHSNTMHAQQARGGQATAGAGNEQLNLPDLSQVWAFLESLINTIESFFKGSGA